MQLFKRISSTVLSSVDKAVSQIENHDAVVESMLKDLQQAAAETRIRLKRVQKDGESMRERLQKLQDDEQRWTERATECADKDDEKALACLSRRQTCRDQMTKLETTIEQHLKTEKQLVAQQSKIDQRQREISQQRHLLKSKEAVADANRVVAAVAGGSYGDIDDAFDRWEISIAKSEYASDTNYESYDECFDPLDDEFNSRDANLNLQSELDELKATK